MANDCETAERIRLEVIHRIKHEYASSSDAGTLPWRDAMRQGRGRCGQRASAFQALAEDAGLKTRIVIWRGHVENQVEINGVWHLFGTTAPRHQYEQQLIDIIRKGPINAYAFDADYMQTRSGIQYMPERFGQYSSWLKLLRDNTHLVLPKDLLNGKGLLRNKPNVIIRHDVDCEPERIISMLHEENALGIRSAVYVRVDQKEYDIDETAPLFQMFEDEGFEIGLHITAVDRLDMTRPQAMAQFWKERDRALQYFKVETVQAHGYEDVHGVSPAQAGTYDNYDIERFLDYGFANLVNRHGFAWRIADSLGVMYPGDPAKWIPKMRPGALYYCLWHPEYYCFKPPWTEFTGLMADSYSRSRLKLALPQLNRQVADTSYFSHAEHPHLQAAADYLRKNIKNGESVVDLACGWGLLNILIKKPRHWWIQVPHYEYVGVESAYARIKAAQKLHMMLRLPMPRIIYDDLANPKSNLKADWVVFLGWEGDIKTRTVLNAVPPFASPSGHILLSYIAQEEYDKSWADKYPKNHYCTMSMQQLDAFVRIHRLTINTILTSIYRNGFPRHLVALSR